VRPATAAGSVSGSPTTPCFVLLRAEAGRPEWDRVRTPGGKGRLINKGRPRVPGLSEHGGRCTPAPILPIPAAAADAAILHGRAAAPDQSDHPTRTEVPLR